MPKKATQLLKGKIISPQKTLPSNCQMQQTENVVAKICQKSRSVFCQKRNYQKQKCNNAMKKTDMVFEKNTSIPPKK